MSDTTTTVTLPASVRVGHLVKGDVVLLDGKARKVTNVVRKGEAGRTVVVTFGSKKFEFGQARKFTFAN